MPPRFEQEDGVVPMRTLPWDEAALSRLLAHWLPPIAHPPTGAAIEALGGVQLPTRSAFCVSRGRSAHPSVTCGSLFSGGGGWEVGLVAAGLTPRWGIEIDPAAADTYERNLGAHVLRQSVLDVDPAHLAPVDVLLASPPCSGFSVARRKDLGVHGTEDLGLVVPRYVAALRPRVLLLENVVPYMQSDVFRAIVAGLHALGYLVDWQSVNAADVGVPQSRRRLILRAVRESLLPPWPATVPHVGWYAAIEDLLPTLPESRFAPWQLERLKDYDWAQPFLHMTGNTQMAMPTGTGIVPVPEPANTVCGNSTAARAYLVSGTDALVRVDEEPSMTLAATLHDKAAVPRAYLVDSKNDNKWGDVVPDDISPAPTVLRSHPPRAFVVDGQSNDGQTDITIRTADDPMYTLSASMHKRPTRAALGAGRVVAMTPRALARFQSFPDSYELPASTGLACRIIGNAVPPLLARRLIEPFLPLLAQGGADDGRAAPGVVPAPREEDHHGRRADGTDDVLVW
jgi:DNA (cytosine-5)-methyltransferase 1